MNSDSFTQNATATAITEGKWKLFVSSLSDPSPSDICIADRTIRIHETAFMMKQKTMLPAVSILALPDGNLRASTFLTALLQTMSVTFERGSKIASAIVVHSDSEPEVDEA